MTPVEFIPADELSLSDVAQLSRAASDATARLQAANASLARAQRNKVEADAAVVAAQADYDAAQAHFAGVYEQIQSTISRDVP